MKARTQSSYQTFLHDFLKFDIWVVCPVCTEKAVIKAGDSSSRYVNQSNRLVICAHCGYNKQLSKKPSDLALWLKTDFKGHSLWAYNQEHLDFLQDHIGATLRERNGQKLANSSLGSRLPKWMISRHNRESLLKKIIELQNKNAKK